MNQIDNFINGNLSDAKARSVRVGWSELYIALRDEYDKDEREARAIANYLKGKGTFQAACGASPKGQTMITPIQHAKQQKHTPGKLIVEKLRGNDWSIGTDSAYVAACDSGSEDNKSNAARLAHCWNVHDQLVEACQSALDGLYSYRYIEGNCSAMSERDKLRAALLAATGKDTL